MAPEKAPAFQLYADQFLTDENQVVMSLDQVGAYTRLMCYCWREITIPDDPVKLARMVGTTPAVMKRLWPGIRVCFCPSSDQPGRLRHARLDVERQKQQEWREKSAEGGRKAQARRKAAPTTLEPPLQPKGDSLVSSLQFPVQTPTGSEEDAPKGPTPADLRNIWNEETTHLPKCQKLTPERERHAAARLREESDLEEWRAAIRRLDASRFANGENDRGWRADFDFLLKPGTLTKIREGKYDNRAGRESFSAAELSKAEDLYRRGWGARCHHEPPCADRDECIHNIVRGWRERAA